MGATPLHGDEADDAEHTGGHRGAEQQIPDVQVQAVPVAAVSYPQGPRITIRPRADPSESGRGSRTSSEVRIDRGPAYMAEAPPPPPPPLPSRFATTQDGSYNTIIELPPAAGMGLEPRFRAAEQQNPEGGYPPHDQTPEGDEMQEEEGEEAQEGTDQSDGGDVQLEASFPPPPPRPAMPLFSQVVRLQPAEPYGNLHEYSAGYPGGQQQQQRQAGSEEEQLEDADGGEAASESYDDGIIDGEGSGGEPGQQEQHPPPLPPPMSSYQQQPYHYQYQQQRAHEDDAV